MKVKVLNRDPKDYLKTRAGDLPKLPRNVDPALHPFAAQREYTAALNAVKLERVFAKPFVGSLDGEIKNFVALYHRKLGLNWPSFQFCLLLNFLYF